MKQLVNKLIKLVIDPKRKIFIEAVIYIFNLERY